MTKIRKQKRKKKFRANVNRKRLRNKLQKLPKIECEEIENSWESKRSIRTNLKDMGLAYNPNEVLKIPSTKRGIIRINKQGERVVEIEDEVEENDGSVDGSKREKIHVANKLEADAKAPRERLFRLPKSQVHFVTYLMDKYGDDYKAMARDRKNHYQMTWCQIRAKINTFKSIPEQYAEYLLKSGEIVLDDPTPLEETRRKVGEENFKKYCARKERKVVEKERKRPVWDVESDNENMEFLTEDKDPEKDLKRKNKTGAENGVKKLKLFPEDDISEEENSQGDKTKGIKSKEKPVSLKSKESGAQNLQKNSKKLKKIQKSQSSDSDSDEIFEGEGEAEGFINLSDMSEEELSEDDVLDDGEFVTDSNDESD